MEPSHESDSAFRYSNAVFFHSFDYEDAGYEPAELIKIDFLLNGRPVEELTTIVHK